MKTAKIIGLAAVAALALMASAGAASALAAVGDTVLCKSAEDLPYCSAEDRYPAKTAINAQLAPGGTFLIEGKNPNVTVQCTSSALSAETLAASGDPLSLSVSSWTLGGCSLTKGLVGSCTVTTLESSMIEGGSLRWSEGGDGTFALGTVSRQGWYVKCKSVGFIKMDCEYEVQSETVLQGGKSAHFKVDMKNPVISQGSLCPETSSLKAEYQVTTPEAIYVATEESGTELCAAKEQPCAAANRYAKGTKLGAELNPGSNLRIVVPGGLYSPFVCSKASMGIDTQANIGEPLPVELTSLPLSSCNAGSMGTLPCTVETSISKEKGPSTIGWQSGYSGSLGNLTFNWKFDCLILGLIKTWTFKANGLNTTLSETGSTINLAGIPLACEGTYCPGETAEITAGTFVVTSPKPVYVTHR